MKINYIISDNTVTVFYEGKAHMVARTNNYADKLIDALKSQSYEKIPELLSAAERIKKFSNGVFTVEDGKIMIEGKEAPGILGQKIKEFSDKGLPYQPLVAFAKNLAENPSSRARQDLYSFLEKNNHPITDNGHFIAYKKVRDNFKDVYTNTMDNSVGKVVKMGRSQVNEDPNVTCSFGLHVSNWNYCQNFYAGGITLELEVNPKHVVAIPVDYNQAKIRVCEYKVLSVIEEEHQDISLRTTNETYSDLEEEEQFYCEECDAELDDDFETLCTDCLEVEQEEFDGEQ